MPNIKSAKKRVLVNQKKNLENKMILTQVKNAIKSFNNLLDTNQIEAAEKALPATMSMLDSAVVKGLIHKNNAANKKSAMAKRLNDIKTGKLVVDIKKDNKTIASEKAKAAQALRDAQKAENAAKRAEKEAAKKAEKEAKAKDEKKTTAKKTTTKKATTKKATTKKADKEEKAE